MNGSVYAAWVVCGAIAGLWFARHLSARSGVRSPIAPRAQRVLRGAALLGAVAGAYVFEIPADAFGWTSEALHAAVWGGRTVLGGVLGGWLALEWTKHRLHITASTGPTFTAPLALAFGFGRLGCHWGGCCQGRLFDDIHRWPVPLMESGFDFLFAAFFAWPWVEKQLGSRLFPAFIGMWATMRFGLEFLRENPAVLWGLSYYQYLAMALSAAAGLTWWHRRHGDAKVLGLTNYR